MTSFLSARLSGSPSRVRQREEEAYRMVWLFVPEERVRTMSVEEAMEALRGVISARQRVHRVAVASGPVLMLAAIAFIGLSWWLVPALLGAAFSGGLFRFWAWHSYRSACVLGLTGYARDALVGRWVTADNLGFGPHR
ncbi:hypothetical protein [Vitiosangium sp. GDMCC 1.1324]|uniref:hypothetical protein n=1 Tax=Vitiosangium sp. (strain GDMCC 1.1324) TaxID=2138576 RepID=UPI000D379404|nr:hypothetical protein [Vitiosangium sp. GDMCC 1.1324]PTL76514.1 hypothetical protein DAT35_48730 [Vitiosangium sp. GDMCC 1.1324]